MVKTITRFGQDCKSAILTNNRDIFVVVMIVGSGFLGFGLGRLSKIGEMREPITFHDVDNKSVIMDSETPSSSSEAFDTMSQGASLGDVARVEVVASKSGSRYHFPWCSGARTIKEENMIKFSSIKDAEKAGYTKALNCKGL
ncbi:MAG: hypothetical protein COV07_01050 [Candidatus Vogelbacteria bacterium CG10_big_fil_rev_8_21_14_0_10_45_14]|uniref:Ada DNA repair metal-binding domain-containing protein n=1 Tax=Candidatus Vogelbacteria bacterium CG10_big_fil_rev_8_21_14_0_10_45_14 TaxID=1975042 RepID=A0A2H0RM18_9BACT|nr:MAG: hypothetical protein COV07_01050 [Candidatus Vogelbacteria bacterium CG10_big_fil_rev_8_21_14_0_10_45_14]